MWPRMLFPAPRPPAGGGVRRTSGLHSASLSKKEKPTMSKAYYWASGFIAVALLGILATMISLAGEWTLWPYFGMLSVVALLCMTRSSKWWVAWSICIDSFILLVIGGLLCGTACSGDPLMCFILMMALYDCSSALVALLLFPWIILPLAHLVLRKPADRSEPRCQECGYLLYGLSEPRCPECGSPFNWRDVPVFPSLPGVPGSFIIPARRGPRSASRTGRPACTSPSSGHRSG